MSNPPNNLGLQAGKLRPCPDRPNCVCSQSIDAAHAMPPIAFSGSTEEAIARLREVIAEFPRAKVVAAEGAYLRAEFTSAILGFIDDVEFLVDEQEGVIHFRSASRVGYSDFRANRRRMTELREKYPR